jgi:hypothetical protein
MRNISITKFIISPAVFEKEQCNKHKNSNVKNALFLFVVALG